MALAFPLLLSSQNIHAGERAYLHLDNTAYFPGDTLRLSAFVIDTDTRRLSEKSKVLYVELLSPEGSVIESKTYPLLKGRAAGDICLHPLVLSGLFEIRTYTRYMLNEGRDNCFSKVIPVYEKVHSGQIASLQMRHRDIRTDYQPQHFSAIKADGADADLVKASYDASDLKPFQPVKVPMADYRMAARFLLHDSIYRDTLMTDSAERFQVCLGDFSGYGELTVTGKPYSEDKNVEVRLEHDLVPALRTYSTDELELQDRAIIGGTGIKVDNLTDKNLSGWKLIVWSALHLNLRDVVETMMDDETETGYRYHPRQPVEFIYDFTDKCGLYARYSRGLRFVLLDGEYPGDDVVPTGGRILDGYPFRWTDYRDMIVRTDRAICDAYSYDRHNIRKSLSGPTWCGLMVNISDGYPHGAPSIVVCMVPKTAKERKDPVFRYMLNGRTTQANGYSLTTPYCQPDYSTSHPQEDHRRTLYWNPDVELDGNGQATITFYNNGTCRQLVFSGEGVSEEGKEIVCQ